MSEFLDNGLFIQGVGLLASFFMVLAYVYKSDVKFKVFLTIGTLFLGIHFYFLGALSGMAISLINSARIGTSIKFHQSNLIMILFILAYIFSGLYFFENAIDFLPIISGIIGALAMYKLSGIKLRITMSFVSIGWLVHNVLSHSLGGIVTEIFISSVNIITITRLFLAKK